MPDHKPEVTFVNGPVSGLGSLPKSLKMVALYTVVGSVGPMMYGGVVTPFGRALGLEPATIGLYFTTFSLISVITSMAGGILGDRIGHRRVLVLGRAIWALQAVSFAVARDWRMFLFTAVIRGLADLTAGPAMTIAAGIAQDTNRATVFGVLSMVQSATGVLAPVAGGYIADTFGPRATFLAALPFMVLATYLAGILPIKAPEDRSHKSRLSVFTVLSRPESATARLILVFMFLNGIHNAVLNLLIPLVIQDRFGVAYTGISALTTAGSLGTMMTAILGGRLADKYGRGRVCALLMVVGMMPMLGLAFVSSMAQVYVIFFVSCLIANAATPGAQALFTESVPAEVRGTFVGSLQSIFGVAYGLASAVVGRLYVRGPALSFGLFYINLVLSVLIVLAIAKTTVPRAPAPEPADGSRPAWLPVYCGRRIGTRPARQNSHSKG